MAVNITLNIYDKAGGDHIKRIYLYFGKSLRGLWDGWKWVESQGFSVDGPWAYDNGNEKKNYEVTKAQLIEWLDKGFLSVDVLGRDNSTTFLDQYPEDSIFLLNFVDWS